MPKTTMAEDRDFSTPAPAELAAALSFMDPLSALPPAGTLGSKEQVQKELDLMAAAIRTFYQKTPDQVMRECSGYSARLTELAVLLHRIEPKDSRYARVRTQQVERFLAEIDRQWKTASRLLEVSRQDIELSR